MDDAYIDSLKEALEDALKLREESDNMEKYVAEQVGNEVQEWLDLGKKSKALELIKKVYGQGNERSKYWHDYFQKLIYTSM